MSATQLPAALVATGQGVPEVCARHGQPAVERKSMRIAAARPPGWAYPLAVLGAIVFLTIVLALRRSTVARLPGWAYPPAVPAAIVFQIIIIIVLALRKAVAAPNWPFCGRCKALRVKLLVIGLGLVGLAELAFVSVKPLADSEQAGGLAGLVALFAFVALFAGGAVAARGSPVAVAGARTSHDGRWVLVEPAHGAFARRAAELSGYGAVAGHPQPGAQYPPAGYPPPGYPQPPVQPQSPAGQPGRPSPGQPGPVQEPPR